MKHRLVLLGLLLLCHATPCAAQQPSEANRLLAQSLFEQAKQLMTEGKYGEACPKLEQSQGLEAAAGTLLNLALCHEQQGKIATAWADFKAALSVARRDGRQDRIAAAEEHIASLEPRLPWLTVSVAGTVKGLVVSLDGASLAQSAFGTPFPVDPGSHELRAEAPGRMARSETVVVTAGERRNVTVPPLDPLRAQPGPAVPPASSVDPVATERPVPARHRTRDKGTSALPWVLGSAGVLALGVGTYFGFRTLSKRQQSDTECPTDTTCSREGVKLNDQAWTSAWISNGAFGLGVIGVGVGSYLLLTNSADGREAHATRRPASLALTASLARTDGDVRLQCVW